MKTKERSALAAHTVRRLLTSWLAAAAAEFWLLPGPLRDLDGLEGLARMSLVRAVCIAVGVFLLLWALSRRLPTEKGERWLLAGIFALLAVTSLRASFSWAFLGACGLLAVLLVVYAARGWDDTPEPACRPQKAGRVWVWVTAGLAMAFFLFVSLWTVCRVCSFSTPTFDFGIFAQMFHNMKTTGLPVTTVERDGLLSHFRVHMSPIYYLLLPFYCLCPRPATLQVLQAAVITSAVVPLWKLGRLHGLSGLQRTLLCAVLLLYPAFSGGTGYDIHENCFLTPLLLWLLYGIDRKSAPVTAAAAVLTLAVKEDAAVYVAVIALWLLVKTALRYEKSRRRDLITGFCLLCGSVFWFLLVTGYLARVGDGVMTYRYDNFIYDGSASLVTVIQAVLLCPMKAVFECVDREKLLFLAQTLLPLLGLPLLTRRFERYILLIPYILVNLMPDYRYQHDIFFQYTFGSTACLLYLATVNLAGLRLDRTRTAALLGAAAVSAACFGAAVVPRAMSYPVRYIQNREYYEALRETLARIPEDASVTAATFYTTFLSQRETLYDLRYSSQAHMLETQYVALRPSAADDFGQYDGYENLVKLLERSGYVLFAQVEGVLEIYERP